MSGCLLRSPNFLFVYSILMAIQSVLASMKQHVWNDAIAELKIACKMRAMCAVFSLIKRKPLRNSVGAGEVKGWVGTLASPRVD